jgi:hypothetical protein
VHAYLVFLVDTRVQTKVFVMRPDGVIRAIVHGAEGVKMYFLKLFLNVVCSFCIYDLHTKTHSLLSSVEVKGFALYDSVQTRDCHVLLCVHVGAVLNSTCRVRVP